MLLYQMWFERREYIYRCNATLRDHIKIGKSNVIGAGALILNDTENNKSLYGKSQQSFKSTK